jgi:hypothetical protein
MVELMRYAIAISATWYPHFKGTDLGVIMNYQGRIAIIRLLLSNFSLNLSNNCFCINRIGTIAPIA